MLRRIWPRPTQRRGSVELEASRLVSCSAGRYSRSARGPICSEVGGPSSWGGPSGRIEVLLVCSPGGHALQLGCLADEAWDERSHAWVTLQREDARMLEGEHVVLRVRADRAQPLEPRQEHRLRLAARPPPEAEGDRHDRRRIAVPFAWVGRLFGAKIVYIESLTRIEGPSLSYRLVRPVTSRVYVQWPELAATVAACALSSGTSSSTHDSRHDRNERTRLRPAAARGRAVWTSTRTVVVQHGPRTLRPSSATAWTTCSFDRFVELVQGARVVVTHAGVGSILTRC